jgi:hypothetical protein
MIRRYRAVAPDMERERGTFKVKRISIKRE